MTPHMLPLLRMLSHEDFRSGEELSQQIGLTRASVCNALRAAEQWGLSVQRVRGRGYRLPYPVSWLDASALQAHLGALSGALEVELLDHTVSTSSLLVARAHRSGPHASVVAAEIQTGGRGRRGRNWLSDLGGGLTFSLLWRMNEGMERMGGLSLATGLALVRALDTLGHADIRLKWPNDVLHHHRKLAGILVELQGEALGPAAAVIGIGLNVRLSPETLEQIDQAAVDLATLSDEPVDRNRLLAELLREMHDILEQFSEEGFAPFLEEWESRHAYHDRPVRLIQAGGSELRGTVKGVDADGALLLNRHGVIERVVAGEMRLRPAA
jgi:BirA family transcriptional regulator, biotin operon repressor / biotin---[acetyl-CoA-carboxylase] ligase